jgi:acetyltransferase-like isoleucine patch superfamily enzyme
VEVAALIHPLATVENSVVHETAKVWQYASVIRQARVGARTTVATCAIVDGAWVGEDCIISHGVFLDPGVRIGCGVFVGPHVSFCNDVWPRVDKVGFDWEALQRGGLVTIEVEDGASIGAGAIILPGVRIGRCAMVAAGAVVEKDVRPYVLRKRDGTDADIDERRIRRTRAVHRSVPVAAE